MRRLGIIGCTYLLLLSVPLQVMASSVPEGNVNASATAASDEQAETAEQRDSLGPGKRMRRARHKERRKRMGKHKNLSDRANGGIFGKGKKKDGTGQSVMIMIIPAVAVAGLAVLFVTSTNKKNSEPVPDPTETN